MTKKFECWDCHKTFQADNLDSVNCPYCHSDNVDLASSHIPYSRIIVVTTILAVLGIGIYFILQREHTAKDSFSKEVTVTEEIASDTSSKKSVSQEENAYVKETGLSIPPSITPRGEKKLNDNKTYSFKVIVDNAPANSYKIILTDKITGNIVAESKDGNFTEVPPSKADGGVYLIQIVDDKTDSLLCTPQTMDGFLPVKKVDHKLSVEELQKLLDSEDETLIGNGENHYLAPGYKIHYKGLSNGDSHPTNLADVIEKIYMSVWSSVKVESLEYDESSHISSITLIVTK